MKLTLAVVATFLSALTIACGGSSHSSNPLGGTIGGPASSSGAVTVAAGATTSSVDITVQPGTPPLNALVLGTAALNASGGSASNTGASIPRGTEAQVLMFGTGLNGNLQVSISGPNDIAISGIQAISSTKGTPGVEFVVAVPSSAAPGARTVYLRDASGNTTTFTGGLEVQ